MKLFLNFARQMRAASAFPMLQKERSITSSLPCHVRRDQKSSACRTMNVPAIRYLVIPLPPFVGVLFSFSQPRAMGLLGAHQEPSTEPRPGSNNGAMSASRHICIMYVCLYKIHSSWFQETAAPFAGKCDKSTRSTPERWGHDDGTPSYDVCVAVFVNVGERTIHLQDRRLSCSERGILPLRR